jgi:ribosome maturation factor RimP
MSTKELQQIQLKVEDRLAEAKPEVELLTLERVAAERLRLVIDRPEGVDLALCEEVTRLLEDLNEEWSLEVSSPGPERPLTKPEHFEAFVGHRARVKTSEEVGGRRSFTGTLERSGSDEVTLEVDGDSVSIPLEAVRRANLVDADDQLADGADPAPDNSNIEVTS